VVLEILNSFLIPRCDRFIVFLIATAKLVRTDPQLLGEVGDLASQNVLTALAIDISPKVPKIRNSKPLDLENP
jgi:hypothetical protein